MTMELTTENWSEFNFSTIKTIDDCYAASDLLSEVIDKISAQIMTADIKVKTGEIVDTSWYHKAQTSLNYAKRKRKAVDDRRNSLQKAKNAVMRDEEKDRTQLIIGLLERVATSLEQLVRERA